MTTVVRDGEGFRIYSKGDAQVLLSRCTAILKRDGSVKKFLPEDNVRLQSVVQQMEQKSQLKVMCIASRGIFSTGKNSSMSHLRDVFIIALCFVSYGGLKIIDILTTHASLYVCMSSVCVYMSFFFVCVFMFEC